jgi:hypothetical protein
MIRQDYIPLECPSEWKEALKGVRHSFGQTWENCYAMHLTTGFKTWLYSFESQNGRVICPIAEREFGGYIDILKPFGFSGFVANGNCSEFPYYWKESARQRGYICAYLGLDPIFDCSTSFDPGEVFQYDTIYVLDLTLSLDELWANLSTNRKRQLGDWDNIRSNLALEKPILADFFLANYVDFFRRKNASQFYFFSRDTLSFLFDLDNVLIVGAPNSGQVEAVSVFTYTADVGEYLFNVSLPEGRNHTAPLLWYGVNYLKSLRIPSLNLGGGGGGMAEFKRRFGGRELALKCIKQIYEPGIYQKLCRRVNADPSDMTGYFPPYQKRVEVGAP